ncbi:hypothetical protein LguiA_009364 [Lonicera macranthoides]
MTDQRESIIKEYSLTDLELKKVGGTTLRAWGIRNLFPMFFVFLNLEKDQAEVEFVYAVIILC